jgi:hypothetical protein
MNEEMSAFLAEALTLLLRMVGKLAAGQALLADEVDDVLAVIEAIKHGGCGE